MEAWFESLRAIAQQTCVRENCILYDIDIVGHGPSRALRLFIDKPDGNVGLQDCENVSKALNLLLDAKEDIIPGGGYHLEVSTPGIERVLKEPWHFQNALGKKIRVKTRSLVQSTEGLDPRKTLLGELLTAGEDAIRMNTENRNFDIPYSVIEKANVVYEMNKQKR
jgi:ribosome maturation factor RimP